MPPDFIAFLQWYLAITLAGAVVWPLAFHFFQRLPDRGYTLTRALGLLLIGWAFWFFGSLGAWPNAPAGVGLATALVAGASVIWLRRSGVRLADIRAWMSEQRPTLIAVEVTFFLAFAVMAWVRAHNPEISGTEKPMELMFLNSIAHSPTFPPTDAWLSGHAISYYYFGYVLVAALGRVTDTAMPVAFNLGLALWFALTAVGALGVVLNMISLTDDGRRKTEDRHLSSDLRRSFWPALLAPLFVLVVGNFYGPLKLAHANGMFAQTRVPAVRYSFGDDGTAPGFNVGMINLWKWLDLKGAETPPLAAPEQTIVDPGFWWWFSGARVVHDRNLSGVETEAIDEMPAFSFILGDLHPHVLALPFVLLAITLALDWLLWGLTQSPNLLISNLLPRFFISALTLGSLAFLNTWDFPIYWFLVTLMIVCGLGLAWGWEALWDKWRAWAMVAGLLAVLSLIAYFPFFFTFQSQAGGLLPNLIYPTRFQQTVVFFGPVLVGVTLWLGWAVVRQRPQLDWKLAVSVGGGLIAALVLVMVMFAVAASINPNIASLIDGLVAPLTRAEAWTLLLQRRLVDSFATLFPAMLVGLTVAVAVKQLRGPATDVAFQSPVLLFVLALILIGALLLIGPEFVYLRDYFGTRMNTLFKFYFQAWMVWALAAAFGVWHIGQWARAQVRWLAQGLLGLAVLAGLGYTLPALYSKANHFQSSQPTLDGLAVFAAQYPDDWAAAQWLNENVTAPAVIAEAIGGSYSSYGRMAMTTGLPTVMGWDFHERQWRGAYFDQVAGRVGDMDTLYTTRDWETAHALLDKYHIEYVIVGNLERDRYKPLNDNKFLVGMQVVFDSDEFAIVKSDTVVIYQRMANQ